MSVDEMVARNNETNRQLTATTSQTANTTTTAGHPDRADYCKSQHNDRVGSVLPATTAADNINNNNNSSNNNVNNSNNNNNNTTSNSSSNSSNSSTTTSNGLCITNEAETQTNEPDEAAQGEHGGNSAMPGPLQLSATPLQHFYANKSVFITGGTGFMGKMLVDKLLRSCPDLANIYLLVRPKRGLDIHSRLDQIFDDPVFATLRTECPKFRHRIVALAGDCSLAGLGLSRPDRATVVRHANVVFHAAATVRFDEKLKLAVGINVHGTREVLDLCAEIGGGLVACVHVSTAYANCHLRFIEEKLYRYPFQYGDLDRLLAKLDDRELEEVTPTILGKWPNTYAFTKALAESVVQQRAGRLPLGVFRPAIVTSSVREPVVGWIDNLYGPTGVIAGVSTGFLRTLHCDRDIVANIVPVDMTVNALIAAAWDVAVGWEQQLAAGITVAGGEGVDAPDELVPVYNYVSSVEKRLTWGEFTDLNVRNGFAYPFTRAMWYLSFHTHKTATMNWVYKLLLHMLPALLVDGALMCCGRRPQMLKVYHKIHKFSDVISFFCTNEWLFTNDNVQRLWRRLGAGDQRLFDFDMRRMDWVEYSYHYIKGMRLYLFKDDLSTVPAARRKWRRLYWRHQMLKTFIVLLLLFVCWKLFAAFFL